MPFPELDRENAGRDGRGGVARGDTGGWELFLSPGLFATDRFTFEIKYTF